MLEPATPISRQAFCRADSPALAAVPQQIPEAPAPRLPGRVLLAGKSQSPQYGMRYGPTEGFVTLRDRADAVRKAGTNAALFGVPDEKRGGTPLAAVLLRDPCRVGRDCNI